MLVHEKDDDTVIVTAPLPVTTFTSDAASMLARSVALRSAFFAVGEHTPPTQFMLCVGFDEISTEACADVAAITAARIASIFIMSDTPTPGRDGRRLRSNNTTVGPGPVTLSRLPSYSGTRKTVPQP